MQTNKDELLRESFEQETHPLIVAMQEFLDYTTHIAEYSLLITKFTELNNAMLESVQIVLDYATDMRTAYYTSLTQETVEDLLQREADIFDEIENHTYSLMLCEAALDKYLIHADTLPKINSVFLTEDGYPLFDTANC